MQTEPRRLLMGPDAVRAGLSSLLAVARQPDAIRGREAWQEALDRACLHVRQSWRLFERQLDDVDRTLVRSQCRAIYHALRAGRVRPAIVEAVCRAVLALQDEAKPKSPPCPPRAA